MATRRERVVLELEDNFTTGMARAAAAAALFQRELDDLDGTNLRASQSTTTLARDNDTLGNSFRRNTSDLNQFTGRMRFMTETALALGPALLPIGAVAVPAVTGLAAQLGFAAGAAGVAIISFQGVGDALEAMRKAQLEPTVANLEAAQEAMKLLAPSARDFVRELTSMGVAFRAVRDAGAEGLFPGLTRSLDDVERVLPKVADIFREVGDAMGDLSADAAGSLAGPKWDEFFTFIETEAPRALTELGHTLGDVAHGFAELWMAFTPLNQSFSGWLRETAADFDRWASSVGQSQGFEDFSRYIRENGPRVADALGSIANAIVQVAQAAAPLGGPVLGALASLADVVASIADSDLGTPLFALAAGMAAVNRAMSAWGSMTGRAISGTNTLTGSLKGLGLAAAGLFVLDQAGALMNKLRDSAIGAAPNVAALTASLTEAGNSNFGQTFGDDLGAALDAAAEAEGGFKGLMASLDEVAYSGNDAFDMLATGALNMLGLQGPTNAAGVETQKLAQAFASLDSALMNVASAQGIDAASRAFEGLVQSQGLTYEQSQQLLDVLPSFGPAMAAAGRGAAGTADGLRSILTAALGATDATKGFKNALIDLNAVLQGRASMRDYEAAIDAASQALKDNGKTLDINTEKGRANQAALDSIAATTLRVAEGMNRADRKDFLRGAVRGLTDAAEAFGMTDKRAGTLARRLLGLDKTNTEPRMGLDDQEFTAKEARNRRRLLLLDAYKANPGLDLEDTAFLRAYGISKADLAWLDKQTATPKADLDISGVYRGIGLARDALNSFDGTSVTTYIATRHLPAKAAGGLITGPGGPTDDKILALLSNREFVQPAATVDYYGLPLMEALRTRSIDKDALALASGEYVSPKRLPAMLPRQLMGAAA